ncbi:universal stress protein [Edaphosphingomonas haloaromaticamans]|uniref:Universal stress protein UspE n=1 Tax=Edaphosphingomonas haloaromaticamans TaxID=653954 RepID=A0A1S1HIK9_9SPHN|nr:universal stress protein [Sphingomonas haloaromaticamans]OHT21682.1 universal stress protein UspE [Sphingomonas haloaromaticamans]
MPMKIESILVASDLSARCDRPVDRAIALSRNWQAHLSVLHVLDSDKVSDDEADVRRRILATLPEGEAEPEILLFAGSAPETIVRTAQERGSDLIVTGVARYNSVGDYVLGTAVDHVIRNAGVPVLVVKQRPHGQYKTLLVATDLSQCSRAALVKAAKLFPDAALHLVHAYHVPYEGWLTSDDVSEYVRAEAQGELDAFLQEPAVPETLRARTAAKLGYGETGQVVAQALRETGADLIILGTHGRSGFAHATIGSTAESLLSWVPVDTLMVREQT